MQNGTPFNGFQSFPFQIVGAPQQFPAPPFQNYMMPNPGFQNSTIPVPQFGFCPPNLHTQVPMPVPGSNAFPYLPNYIPNLVHIPGYGFGFPYPTNGSPNLNFTLPFAPPQPTQSIFPVSNGKTSEFAMNYLTGTSTNGLANPNFHSGLENFRFGISDFQRGGPSPYPSSPQTFNSYDYGTNPNPNSRRSFDEFSEPYSFLPPPEYSTNPPRQTCFDKNAVGSHLRGAVSKINAHSQRFRNLQLALRDDDGIYNSDSTNSYLTSLQIPRKEFQAQKLRQWKSGLARPLPEPRKRYYSLLPNSDGYYSRRRDVEEMPTDYIHQHDLIEVLDPPLRGSDSYPFPKTRVAMGPLFGSTQQVNSTCLDQRSFNLKPNPWKSLLNTEKLEKALEEEIQNIGKNTRSFSDPGRVFRQIGNREPDHFTRDLRLKSGYSVVPLFRQTGPPTHNRGSDFPDLIPFVGMSSSVPSFVQCNLSPRESPVANFQKRLTSTDFEAIRTKVQEDKSKEVVEIDGMGVRRSKVGKIEVIELFPKDSDVDSHFPKDWATAEPQKKDPAPDNYFPQTQRRARFKITAGQGFRFKCGVTLTNSKYFCWPSIERLHALTDSEGNCFVKDFKVGHVDYGHVVFPGITNVAGLNLDTTVEFEPEEIKVYPNPDVAPAEGVGLNRRGIVTLEKIWPRDLISKELLKDKENMSGFEKALREVCKKFDGKFVSYDPALGRWVFEVQKFH